MNMMSMLPIPLRGIDPIQSVKPKELLARQVLARLGIYFRMSSSLRLHSHRFRNLTLDL